MDVYESQGVFQISTKRDQRGGYNFCELPDPP